jgi:hypothetical protein
MNKILMNETNFHKKIISKFYFKNQKKIINIRVRQNSILGSIKENPKKIRYGTAELFRDIFGSVRFARKVLEFHCIKASYIIDLTQINQIF